MKIWIKRSLAALLLILALTYVAASWKTAHTLGARYSLTSVSLPVSKDASLRTRGEYLSRTRGCSGCHGETLAGRHVIDAGPVMQIYSPNLTAGGVLPEIRPSDFEHAVRHGVGRHGQPLLLMPARDYTRLSNDDLAAIYAYLQSLPAQSTAQAASTVGPLGRILHLFGALPLTDAERIDHTQASRGDRAPPIEDLVAYGEYIAQVCSGCHGDTLSGGPMVSQPPNTPPPANLTMHRSGLAQWSESDFVNTMRTGKRPDGSSLSDFMPWRSFGQMDAAEMHALWQYLQSLPPRPTGG